MRLQPWVTEGKFAGDMNKWMQEKSGKNAEHSFSCLGENRNRECVFFVFGGEFGLGQLLNNSEAKPTISSQGNKCPESTSKNVV